MANTKVTGDLLADGTLFARHLNESHGITTSVIGEGTNLYYTNDRVSSYLSSNGYATSTAIIASIVDSAPSTLDTLNELAAALGDDPNFATTVTTAIATKVDGTGTASYLMKWSDSNTATNSVIYDDGTNIGIGTTSPGMPLHVKGNGSYNGYGNNVIVVDDSVGDYAGIMFRGTGGSNSAIRSEGGNSLSFWTSVDRASSWANRMVINSSGNVGIGTTNPGAKLDVVGTVGGDVILRLQRESIGSYDYFVTDGGEGAQQLFLRANNTDSGFIFQTKNSGGTSINALTIAPSSNVGIGTTSPGEKLDVNGNVLATSFGGRAYPYNSILGSGADASTGTLFAGSTNTYVSSIDVAGGGAPNPNTIIIKTASTERMRITSSGRVGINQTNPGVALSVAGQTEPWQLALRSSTTVLGAVIGSPSADVLSFGNWAGTERMRIDSSGNVSIGINDSLTRKFRVYGSGDLVDITSTNSGVGGAQIDLRQLSASPADGDNVGIINFNGLDSSLNNTQYANISAIATSISYETGALVFGTRTNASTYSEKMRIDSDGYLRMASNTGGIQFNGNTAEGNALSAYEQGTFTPTNGGDATGVITDAYGKYTQIGDIVHYRCVFRVTANFTSSPARIGGLPFTVGGSLVNNQVFFYGASDITSTGAVQSMFPTIGTDTIRAYNFGRTISPVAITTSAGYVSLQGWFFIS